MRGFLCVGAQELDRHFAGLCAADCHELRVSRLKTIDRNLEFGKLAGDISSLALRKICCFRIIGHRRMERLMRLDHPLFSIDALFFADPVDVGKNQDPVLLDLVLHPSNRRGRDQATFIGLLRIGERGFLGDIRDRSHGREGDEQRAKGKQHLPRKRPVVEAT